MAMAMPARVRRERSEIPEAVRYRAASECVFSDGASEKSRRCHPRNACPGRIASPNEGITFALSPGRKVEMTRRMFKTVLGVALAVACAARPALAQTQATTTNTTPPPGGQDQSAAAMAQQATNPFSSAWLMQVQQNNNWIEMPLGHGDRMQSNLQFQPLMSMRLTDQWGLYLRPVLTIVNSLPRLDQNGGSGRTSGFGDTVLGVAAAHPLLGGRLVVGVGPTLIFPTASQRELGQDTFQVGPDVGATLLGKHFIAYGFLQQWFKVGGDGAKTNQMNGVFNYTYSFPSGWTIGTQPSLSVDREAPGDDGVAFSIGPQVGKICTCGGLPTLLQIQVQYYPVRPSVGGPQWNVQFQVTPTIPALIRKTLF
jgi:hypothetical protein